MKKKRLLASLLASLTVATALPFSLGSHFQTQAYAKTTAKKTVISRIQKTPDLNPTSSVRSFSKATYSQYKTTFNKEYNVDLMSKPSVFNHHQALVYTASPQLRKYLSVSMKTWNQALGTTVFKTGTSTNYTIRVGFGTGGQNGSLWDGLYRTNKLWVNKSHFNSNSYILTVLEAVSGKRYPNQRPPLTKLPTISITAASGKQRSPMNSATAWGWITHLIWTILCTLSQAKVPAVLNIPGRRLKPAMVLSRDLPTNYRTGILIELN